MRRTDVNRADIQSDIVVVAALAVAVWRHHTVTAIIVTMVAVASVIDGVVARRQGRAPFGYAASWPVFAGILVLVLAIVYVV
jgi:hypothetical protein